MLSHTQKKTGVGMALNEATLPLILYCKAKTEQRCFLRCNYFSVWSSWRRAMPVQESQSEED